MKREKLAEYFMIEDEDNILGEPIDDDEYLHRKEYDSGDIRNFQFRSKQQAAEVTMKFICGNVVKIINGSRFFDQHLPSSGRTIVSPASKPTEEKMRTIVDFRYDISKAQVNYYPSTQIVSGFRVQKHIEIEVPIQQRITTLITKEKKVIVDGEEYSRKEEESIVEEWHDVPKGMCHIFSGGSKVYPATSIIAGVDIIGRECVVYWYDDGDIIVDESSSLLKY